MKVPKPTVPILSERTRREADEWMEAYGAGDAACEEVAALIRKMKAGYARLAAALKGEKKV